MLYWTRKEITPLEWAILYTAEEFLAYNKKEKPDWMIYIEGSQLFVDPGLINRPHHELENSPADYYSQW